MKYYSVAETEITDQSWVTEYVKNVTRMAERLGGRFLARTSKIEKIEGERKAPQILTVIEWPSKETAEAFYESDDYRRHRQGRIKGQEMSFCSWQEKT